MRALVGAINGVLGDYLQRTRNALATSMTLVVDGQPLALTREALARAYPAASPRVVVLVHGLAATEQFWEMEDGSTYGSRLASDLGLTALFVRYNSGLHVGDNGQALDALLEALLDVYPRELEELTLIGHSMGGLVIRSATHFASVRGHRWLARVRRVFYLASPHLGSPVERIGRFATTVLGAIGNPYTVLIAEIADLRSAGIKDMRDGNLKRTESPGPDGPRDEPELSDPRHPVPLLRQIDHHLIAGTVASDPRLSALFGDLVVSVHSATSPTSEEGAPGQRHVRIWPSMNHARISRDPEVYAQIRAAFEERT